MTIDQDPPPPVIDSHHHLWDLSVRRLSWLDEEQIWADSAEMARLRHSFTLADLEPLARAAGVTATVVVQTEISPAETPELLTLAAGHELVAAVVGWVDLAGPGIADTVAALRAAPGGGYLSGIRHPVLAESDPDWLRRPEVLRGLVELAGSGLAYDVVCVQRQLPGALAAAEAVPGLTFVLDHLGNPEDDPPAGGPWASMMGQFAALPNTVCKLSGVLSGAYRDGDGQKLAPLVRQYFEIMLDAFGPDRMMYGSDWPPCTLTSSYQQVMDAARELTAGLSPAERESIMSGTARRIYQLPDPG
ncbi:MAG TPA: amidohydrolase family protein [Streptosporangiaceae bacterium]